jgi:hypothetical protein
MALLAVGNSLCTAFHRIWAATFLTSSRDTSRITLAQDLALRTMTANRQVLGTPA